MRGKRRDLDAVAPPRAEQAGAVEHRLRVPPRRRHGAQQARLGGGDEVGVVGGPDVADEQVEDGDVHPLGGALAGEGLGEGGDEALRAGVGGDVGDAELGEGGDVEDQAGPVAGEVWEEQGCDADGEAGVHV